MKVQEKRQFKDGSHSKLILKSGETPKFEHLTTFEDQFRSIYKANLNFLTAVL